MTADERLQAIALANRLLDEPHADPDDDLRILSRQLLRRHEEIERLRALINRVLEWKPTFPVESSLLDELAAAGRAADVPAPRDHEPNCPFNNGWPCECGAVTR